MTGSKESARPPQEGISSGESQTSTEGGADSPEDFALIIGAMKSGTTSLFELLAQHPEIAASRVKEPRFFSEPENWARGWSWYRSLWAWDPSHHRIALEASPAYTAHPAQPGVPERILNCSGARFKFIYIMRHPLEQLTSHVRHSKFAGWGEEDDAPPPWMLDTVRYAMQIDQYMRHFPRDSLLLLTLEDFSEAPAPTLARICRFLDVSDEFIFSGVEQRYNSGASYDVPNAVARIIRAGPVRHLAEKLLPRRWRHRLRSMLPRLVGRSRQVTESHQLPEGSREILQSLLPDLRRLQSEYGVNVLETWSLDLEESGT